MELKQLITEAPKGFLDRAQKVLASVPGRSELQEVALSGLLWSGAVTSGSSFPNLRIIQSEIGAERRERLARDLEQIGLPNSAAAVAGAVAFTAAKVEQDVNFERYGFTRVLSLHMEGGDTHLNHARDVMAKTDAKSENVEMVLTTFLAQNTDAFAGVAVPEKKGLFSRLFG